MLSLFSTRALAEEPWQLELCGVENQADQAAADTLAAELGHAGVVLNSRRKCSKQPPIASYRIWLESRTTGTWLVLCSPKGGNFDRRLPWPGNGDVTLSTAQRAGQLPQLAILIEGLLLEAVAATSVAPSAAVQLPPALASTGKKPQSRPSSKPNHPESEPVHPAPASAPAARSTPTSRPAPDHADSPTLASEASPRSVDPNPGHTWSLRWQLADALRWRLPNALTSQWIGALAVNDVYLSLLFAPPSRWYFESRPIEVMSLGVNLAWSPQLVEHRGLSLCALMGLEAEYLTLHRSDVPGAIWHPSWELGVVAGLAGVYQLLPMLQVQLRIEGLWLPTSREVVISNGPSSAFNTVGARVTFGFGGVIISPRW